MANNYYNGQYPYQMPNIHSHFNTGSALSNIPQGNVPGTQPFLISNDQSSFNAVPQQHLYMTPQHNTYVAPQHLYLSPQQHPYVVPQQHPYVAPQHLYLAPQQQPYVAPQLQPYVTPQHLYLAPQQQPYVAPQHLYLAPQKYPDVAPQKQDHCLVPQQQVYSNQGHSKNLVLASEASSNRYSFDKSLIQSFIGGNPEVAFDKVMDLKPDSACQAPFPVLEPFKIPACGKSGECRRMLTRDGHYVEIVKWGPGESESVATQGKK